MRIFNEPNLEINIQDMKDGQIGVITQWSGSKYIGQIVQRYGDSLVQLGEAKGYSWPDIFKNVDSNIKFVKGFVRILPKGTQLEV